MHPCAPQARLLAVYRDTADARHARVGRDAVLAILRSDYMLHAPTNSLLQARRAHACLRPGGCSACSLPAGLGGGASARPVLPAAGRPWLGAWRQRCTSPIARHPPPHPRTTCPTTPTRRWS